MQNNRRDGTDASESVTFNDPVIPTFGSPQQNKDWHDGRAEGILQGITMMQARAWLCGLIGLAGSFIFGLIAVKIIFLLNV